MKKYLRDKRGYMFLLLHLIRTIIFRGFSSAVTKTMWFLQGIDFGTKMQFFGLLKTVRFPLSEIKVGSGCIFRSDQSSNLIGVNHRCILSTHSKAAVIKIGNNCGFSGTTIGAYESITIGNDVLCGANTVITDFDWHVTRYASGSSPIVIGDNVWLGLNSVVLKGVTIGEGSIIGANSVVVKDIPPYVIAAGNPCRVLKQLNKDDEK
jgi:acetyltransferase-like isoleucine patch superfamily enzyme